MPLAKLIPSSSAARRAAAVCKSYRRGPISAGQWEAGYQVVYRPMVGRWQFAPSTSILLVVPSVEEVA